jgi:predicted RNA-binding protein (virulence factor B family)
MILIGKYNQLKINKEVDFGLYLDGIEEGEILLPKRYIKNDFKVGDTVEVFIYNDSEDRLIATTEKPLAIVGEFAYLQVLSVTNVGAFLNWGLSKDLLVPFSEQKTKMTEQGKYLIYIYLDAESKRIVASAKLDKYLDNIPVNYSIGEEVKIIIADETDIGYKAIINNLHWGLIYKNEIFQKLATGQKLTAFISKIRVDDKIDLALYNPEIERIDDVASNILNELKLHDGFLPYTDKSSVEEIYRIFKVSKKNFKKSIGNLYRRRLILIESNGIRISSEK